MLSLDISNEYFDEEKQEFVSESFSVELEHSLVSLSKWEYEHEKPFLGKEEKTDKEILSYIRAMLVSPSEKELPDLWWLRLSQDNLDTIHEHIEAKKSATWFNNLTEDKSSNETITSELIYYWMIAHQVPPQYETWHLSRLFTLIRISGIKNTPPEKRKKMSASDRRRLNEERLKKYNTKG